MDARPAVNRPPLRNPSPILGSGSLSLLPVRDCAPASPKGGCLVRLQAEAPLFPAIRRPEPTSSLGALDRPNSHIGYANRQRHMTIATRADDHEGFYPGEGNLSYRCINPS
jgi:hypothetical protein